MIGKLVNDYTLISEHSITACTYHIGRRTKLFQFDGRYYVKCKRILKIGSFELHKILLELNKMSFWYHQNMEVQGR